MRRWRIIKRQCFNDDSYRDFEIWQIFAIEIYFSKIIRAIIPTKNFPIFSYKKMSLLTRGYFLLRIESLTNVTRLEERSICCFM